MAARDGLGPRKPAKIPLVLLDRLRAIAAEHETEDSRGGMRQVTLGDVRDAALVLGLELIDRHGFGWAMARLLEHKAELKAQEGSSSGAAE